ncbi:hypothetical protein HGA92_04990 [Candidatus Gracilibacteria bacterium]|nr:hypothetical protein [Candidatus Gracilibacteria bacterium]NUJ98412.1 hypothetical protein [Candidatus Gracilibacteria bacterium]
MEKELDYYISLFKSNSRYSFIKDIKLQEILYLFSGYVSFIYYNELEENNYSEYLKEIKAHTIFVYLGSIIEAITYYFVKTKLIDEKSKRKYLEIEEFKKLQKIEETKNLYICKLENKEISFNDSINFHALINGLKDKKIIDEKIVEKIDDFRKMRNLVHINAFLGYNEYKLIQELEKAFINTKIIVDYIENNI